MSTIGVVDTPNGRTGSVICPENCMPLLRAAMLAQGVELQPEVPEYLSVALA